MKVIKNKSREDKRLDENQEDSRFQRNSKLGKSAVKPALKPSKRSCILPTTKSGDFL
jgi:hypothetical protein